MSAEIEFNIRIWGIALVLDCEDSIFFFCLGPLCLVLEW